MTPLGRTRNRTSRATAQRLAVREAEVFIEQHDQHDRVRPEMGARRPERLRRLQRVAPLHASTTVATSAHSTSKRS